MTTKTLYEKDEHFVTKTVCDADDQQRVFVRVYVEKSKIEIMVSDELNAYDFNVANLVLDENHQLRRAKINMYYENSPKSKNQYKTRLYFFPYNKALTKTVQGDISLICNGTQLHVNKHSNEIFQAPFQMFTQLEKQLEKMHACVERELSEALELQKQLK